MNASEARRKTVENSPLFELIVSEMERAIEAGKFEIVLYSNYHFHDWMTPLGEAVTKVLRDMEFSVQIDDISCQTTISWK
jgi:hypothetical protein